MIGPPGDSRSRGPARPSSVTAAAVRAHRFVVTTVVDLRVHRSGVTTVVDLRAHRSGVMTVATPHVPRAKVTVEPMTTVNAQLPAEVTGPTPHAGPDPVRRFGAMTGRTRPGGATRGRFKLGHVVTLRAARAVVATKARPGTLVRSRAAADPSRLVVADAARRHGPVAGHLFALAHHEVKARERNGADTPVGRAVPADRHPVLGVRGVKAMVARGRPEARQIVAAGQGVGLEDEAADPKATRRGALVVGRDL